MTKRYILILVAVLCAALFAASVLAAGNEYVARQVIVKFKTNATAQEKDAIKADLHGKVKQQLRLIDAELWDISGGNYTVPQAVSRYKGNGKIQYIEPNYLYQAVETPNDPRFNELWGLNNTGQTGGTPDADIDAPEAWETSTGSANVLVVVIDTGIDYNHPDLAANVWTNPGEIAGNGIDDDGNGFIDDIHGWDFYNNDNDPFDDNGHGTHCSGTIGGVGNNGIGVAGVNWNVRIMGVKFLSSGGSGSTAGAVSSISYALTIPGVKVMSNSWGGGGYSSALEAAIDSAYVHGVLFVCAAGNNSANTDLTPYYPCDYTVPNVMSIGASTHTDEMAYFSNYGATTVDLFAPGLDILSTTPGNTYSVFSGTSMATPHTSGVAALVWSRYPNMSCEQVKTLLINSVDEKAAFAGKCVSGGRLNALFAVSEPDTIPPGAVIDLAVMTSGSNTIGLAWTAPGDDDGTGTASAYDVRYSTSTITEENWGSASPASGEPDPQPAGTPETMTVAGLDFETTYYFAIKALDEYGNAGPISNVPSGTTLGAPDIAVAPTEMSEELISGGTSTQTLTLYNMAEGTLDFSIPMPALILGTSVMQDYLAVGKDEEDPRAGQPAIEGQGGPDVFGYRWIDSDELGGPAFDWVDITGIGTAIPLSGDDSYSGPIPIGFPFEFYGSFFESFYIATNGLMSFTSASSPYSNQPLPNGGAPENLIAPFWDDLTFTAGGDAYYYYDGTRLVVEWYAVPHYSSGGPYTFEVILYPGGDFVFQYLAMGEPTNSATVGIQNGTKTDGLQVVFNAPYVHDNLAIRFSKVPMWLSVTPSSGTVTAGSSIALSVDFASEGLLGGYFYANINVASNDPDEPVVTVPVTLHVLGAPDIDVSPTSIDFGELFVGATATATIVVSNPGTDQINVTSIVSDNPDFTVDASSFSVPPRAARNVVVSFAPSVAELRTGTLTITSNDPDEPTVLVSVQGTGLVPPEFIVVEPASLYASLVTGQAQNQNVTIRNSGGSNLIWSASVEMYTGTVEQHTEYIEYPKGVDEPAGEIEPLGSGGPDVFGYKWIDSDQAGGPAFGWVEISGVGTSIPLTGDDQNPGVYPIGFTFPFYTGSFSTFRICSNGWISFSSTSTAYSNTMLPNSASSCPKDLLAIFWDDLTFTASGGVTPRAYYRYDGTKTIIEFQNVRRISGTGTGTFEIILYPNGRILYQYLTMTYQYKNSATIGIQNSAGTDGLTANYNTNYVHDNLAILFAVPPEWLKITPKNGTVPPGGVANVIATFNATDLLGGEYLGAVHFASNDPIVPVYDIPAELDVTGAPDIGADPASLDFGSVFLGYTKALQMRIVNQGTDVLDVHDIVAGSSEYTVDETAFSLPPYGTQLITVVFAPSAVGNRSSTLTVMSNDPDEASFVIPVASAGLIAPDIAVTPPSVSEDLFVGENSTQTVRIDNTGGSDLNFLIGIDFAGMAVQHEYVEYGKDEVDPNSEPQLLGSGGPDLFGYRWIDSDEPGGPIFDWVEISTIGTAIPFTGDDQNLGWFPIGFSFPFYGTDFTQFRAVTNGWLSFSEATATAYTNSGLPSTGAPKNLLALFWDDLTFLTSGDAYYYYDGTRTIIEYKDVPRLAGDPYTMEVILYPNGKIVYQYLSMAGTRLNEATIGIQNADGTDGLTVVYNANYVHNGMAIEFSFMPEWLTVAPTTGTIPAGEYADLTVGFDAADLFGGDYVGELQIRSNDPDEGLVNVPANLHVTGSPDIDVTPLALDFGWQYIGLTKTLEVTVYNAGTDLLEVTSIGIDNPEFTADTTPFTVAPREQVVLDVVFAPANDGPRAGILTINSNDVDEAAVQVALAGVGVLPPDIAVSPMSLSASLLTGETETQTVRIDNTGATDLNFTIAADLVAASVVQHEYVERGKDEIDTNSEPQLLNRGGPDVFGYRWVDSDEPGGPTFDWVDISTIGTPLGLTGDDQNVGPFPIGFTFSFYGTDFTQFRASSNGFLSMTSTSAAAYNSGLPSTGAPFNMLGVFWDDMDFRYGGSAYYYYDGTRTIIEYKDVPHYTSTGTGTYTYEVILYPSGKIVFQYLSMVGMLNSATIGIQNADGTDGLQVVYNADYVHNGLAIQMMSLPEWLSATPSSGTIPAGEFLDLSVLFDAAGMLGGDYDGGLDISSNDPDEALVTVAAHLHVTPAPDIDVTPLALDFGWLYIGLLDTLQVTVENVGTADLDVTSVVIDNSEFTIDTTPFTLAMKESKVLDVIYTPATAGEVIGTLSFFSNDADEPEVQVSLAGEGVVPPEIEVDPASLCAAALPGMTKTKILSICNTGGSDLVWEADAMQNVMGEQQSYLELGKEEVDPRPGILGTGGPDAFGYTWVDSDEPGGPTYDWVDISGVGTPIFGDYYDDRTNGPFPLGMNFPFYGNMFSQFYVCTNGWISFTSTKTSYSNQPLPNAGSTVPENLLAAFWDDMVVDDYYSNEVYYYNDGSRLIVQFEVRRIATYTPPFYSFEIILYPDGRIVYQYRTLGSNVTDATIGIQNATRDVGLTVVYNASYVHTGLAVQFSFGPEWLSITPESGTIPAGECTEIAVTFSALALEPDVYTGSINIESNDLDEAVVNVPLTFNVGSTTAAYLDVDPNVINLASNGKYIDVNIGLPAGFAIEDVLWDTFFLGAGGEMVVAPVRYEYSGPDEFGVYNLHLKFDREAVEAILPEGESVTITVGGEIDCITYLVGTNDVRVIRPKMNSPNGGEEFADLPGITENLIVSWQKPEDWNVDSYSLYFSADGGESWQEVVTGITTESYIATLPEVATTQGLYRVYAYMNGEAVGYDTSDEPFTILREGAGVTDTFKPTVFALKQNWPNPFGGSTTVVFDLPKDVKVELNIFDVSGRLVKSLVDQTLPAGRYTLGWDGRDTNGDAVASGVYFYKIDAGEFRATKRMVLVK